MDGLWTAWRVWAALLGITLAAGVLRFYDLNAQPLWYDEQLQVAAASAPDPWTFILRIISHSAAAPLDYVGTWVSLTLFDNARVWPALVGTLTVPLLYLVGRKWYGETVGLVGAVLLAFAPFHVYYSQEARYYAASALVAVLCLWTFPIGIHKDAAPEARSLLRPADRDGGVGEVAVEVGDIAGLKPIRQPGLIHDGRSLTFAASVALTLYTFYFAFLVPLTLVAIHRSRLRELLWGVVAFLPWVLLALPSQLAQNYPQADGLSIYPTGPLVAQLLMPDFEVSGLPWFAVALPIVLVLGLAVYGRAWELLLLASVAVVGTGISTMGAGYFWSPRQVLFTLPLLILAMSVGVVKLPRYVAAGALVAVVGLWLPFTDGVTGADAWQPRTEELSRR